MNPRYYGRGLASGRGFDSSSGSGWGDSGSRGYPDEGVYGYGTGSADLDLNFDCGAGSGYAEGEGTHTGIGSGECVAFFYSVSVKGDDNLLGLFHAKASFLGDLPSSSEEEYITLAGLAVIADWLKLARDLGVEAKVVLVNEDGDEIEELCA